MKCDAVAYQRPGVAAGKGGLLAFSGACGSTEARAIRAALGVNRDICFRFEEEPPAGQYSRQVEVPRVEEGYDTWIRPLGFRQYHVVALSRADWFLIDRSPESIFARLSKTTTTPIDERWSCAIAAQLEARNLLAYPTALGPISPCVLHIDTTKLDEIVAELVKNGKVQVRP